MNMYYFNSFFIYSILGFILESVVYKFYSSCKVISDDKELTNARLFLCGAVRIIIKNILDMFEVDAPEVMN